jgi:hypothetical protein
MTETELPEYLTEIQRESIPSLNISWEDYRALARNALRITQMVPSTMGIYKTGTGVALDIWSGRKCLTIRIDSDLNHICLLLAENIDSPETLCILSLDNSEDDWRRLSDLARREILKS